MMDEFHCISLALSDMNFIHGNSTECMKSELDLFEAPSTQTSLERADWIEYPPLSTLTDNGPLEFYISGAGNEYIDLLHTNLYLKARITNEDGTMLGPDDAIGPANYFLASLFSQVEVTLNGRSIGHSNALYPYRSMIEVLTQYGPNLNKGFAQNALFQKDTTDAMKMADPRYRNPEGDILGFSGDRRSLREHVEQVEGEDDDAFRQVVVPQADLGNHGLYWRSRFSKESQWVELMGPIHCDPFQQERFLLNHIDLAIKFTRSKPQFCLMHDDAANRFKIDIQDATLYVRKVTIADHVFLAHQQALNIRNAIYPVSYTAMKAFSIPQGNLSGPQDNIFLGQLPQEIIIAFVDNDAANGNYAKNPFNFKHMDIRYLVIKYGGKQIPAKPLTFNFDDAHPGGGLYARAFHHLCAANGRVLNDKASLIERPDFPRGYALFCFDFRPDIGCRGHYSLKQSGATQVDIEFRHPLPQTINMVVYATFDSYFEVTASRDIIMPM